MMRPVLQPNLPKSRVTLLAVGERGAAVLCEPLAALGVKCLSIPPAEVLPKAEADHADLHLHHIGGNIVIISQEINCKVHQLYSKNFDVRINDLPLNGQYPGNVALNLCRIGNCGIHKLSATAPILTNQLRNAGVRFVDTRQGYSKCSICIVDEGAVITSDPNICGVLEATNIQCLQIAPRGVTLDGMDSGFIGGASGKLAPDILAFTGHLREHPDERRIYTFAKSRGVGIICLTDRPCFDVGSMLPLMEENCTGGAPNL